MYPFAMALRLESLPSDPARLTEMVLSLDAENDRLRAVIATFKDRVFGSRSEKLAAVVADQFALDLADLATDATPPAAANDDHVPMRSANGPLSSSRRHTGREPCAGISSTKVLVQQLAEDPVRSGALAEETK
jgi:transposase